MCRTFGIVLAAYLVLGLAASAQAQEVGRASPGTGGNESAVVEHAGTGGFGMEYSQVPPAYATENFGVSPEVTEYQPEVRYYSRGYRRAPAPYLYVLPQSRLYWPAGAMAPAYNQSLRQQSYGYGYGRGGYGSIFGGMYKGWPLSD